MVTHVYRGWGGSGGVISSGGGSGSSGSRVITVINSIPSTSCFMPSAIYSVSNSVSRKVSSGVLTYITSIL